MLRGVQLQERAIWPKTSKAAATPSPMQGAIAQITVMKTSLMLLAFGAVLLATAGCNTVETSTRQEIGAPKYPPTNPAQVQILRTEPTRPHVRLGEVQAEPSTDGTDVSLIEAALQKEAAKMGADAAVVVCDKTQVTGAMVTGPWWGRSVETIEGRVVIAVAIKYD